MDEVYEMSEQFKQFLDCLSKFALVQTYTGMNPITQPHMYVTSQDHLTTTRFSSDLGRIRLVVQTSTGTLQFTQNF